VQSGEYIKTYCERANSQNLHVYMLYEPYSRHRRTISAHSQQQLGLLKWAKGGCMLMFRLSFCGKCV